MAFWDPKKWDPNFKVPVIGVFGGCKKIRRRSQLLNILDGCFFLLISYSGMIHFIPYHVWYICLHLVDLFW